MSSFVARVCLVAIFVLLPLSDAHAVECGKHERVIKFLGAKYKEQRHAMGLVSNRGVMEFFVSEANGTWTVLLTNTQGIACIVAAGESFERSKPMAKIGPQS